MTAAMEVTTPTKTTPPPAPKPLRVLDEIAPRRLRDIGDAWLSSSDVLVQKQFAFRGPGASRSGKLT